MLPRATVALCRIVRIGTVDGWTVRAIGVVVLTDEMREHARRAAQALGPWTDVQRDYVVDVFATARRVKDAQADVGHDTQVAA